MESQDKVPTCPHWCSYFRGSFWIFSKQMHPSPSAYSLGRRRRHWNQAILYSYAFNDVLQPTCPFPLEEQRCTYLNAPCQVSQQNPFFAYAT